MLKDIYGNAVSTRSRDALERFDHALKQIRTYHGDPVTTLDQAIAHDPDFSLAWTVRAALFAQQTDRLYADEVHRSLQAAAKGPVNDREQRHFAATRAFAEGRFHEGTTLFGAIARDYPRDALALQNGHVGCFFTGRQQDLRDWPLQALRAHGREDEARHAILGMAAFGLEECGDFARAQEMGEEAVAIEPQDAWAAHAVAHVHEMRGDLDHGVPWLNQTSPGWASDCGFAYHNWWHLALLHLDRGDTAAVLRIYDEKVRPNPGVNIVMEMLDASALLWRLRLEGVDTGDRFRPLADAWERTAEDALYAFNDLHAVMAFIGAGRMRDAGRTLEAMRRAAHGADDNAQMTRDAGLPLVEAFMAFEEGRHAVAAETICSVRGVAQRFGGSHAQRDVLTLTALHAAVRGGMQQAAEALAAERLAHKPHSPWARRLAARAQTSAVAVAAE
jgi:Tfp pilus assembly protein PilF